MPLAQLIRAQAAILLIVILSGGWLTAGAQQTQDIQAIPPLSARVIDTTGTLQGAQLQALVAKLAAF